VRATMRGWRFPGISDELQAAGPSPAPGPLLPDGGSPEADVVGAALGLEPRPEGRPAGPAVVGPAAAPAYPREGAVPVPGASHRRQVRIDATRQPGVGPVPAPLVDVAVHVVEAPGVGGVAADPGRAIERGAGRGAVVRLAPEVRLGAAQAVAERGGGRGPGPAGVLPLRLGGQPERPALRQITRPAAPPRPPTA